MVDYHAWKNMVFQKSIVMTKYKNNSGNNFSPNNGRETEEPTNSVGGIYQIRVKGLLGIEWSQWFNEWDITYGNDLSTVLTGKVADQPELHGILNKIRDLNLTLISVSRYSV